MKQITPRYDAPFANEFSCSNPFSDLYLSNLRVAIRAQVCTTTSFCLVQMHMLFQGTLGSFQVEWPDFRWTTGRDMEHNCSFQLGDVGRISVINILVRAEVNASFGSLDPYL
jgi:hypothetical protein